jgi:hypothetical protein
LIAEGFETFWQQTAEDNIWTKKCELTGGWRKLDEEELQFDVLSKIEPLFGDEYNKDVYKHRCLRQDLNLKVFRQKLQHF